MMASPLKTFLFAAFLLDPSSALLPSPVDLMPHCPAPSTAASVSYGLSATPPHVFFKKNDRSVIFLKRFYTPGAGLGAGSKADPIAGAGSGLGADSAVQQLQYVPIRVLIVDGFSNHNWKRTTQMIREILDRSGLFHVDVSTTPLAPAGAGDKSIDSAWALWRPDFSHYDVVIQNTNNIQDTNMRWPRAVEKDLEKYVRGGGGLYILHSANNAFPHWKEYDRMIGLGWRSKETGYALEVDDKGRVLRIPPGQGEGTNHGDRTDATIRILHRHPLNQGFPTAWKTANMEIYRFARGPAKHLEVLSYAYDSASHTNWPVEWVVRYGKGHVYNSSMGHLWKDQFFPISYKSIDFQTIVARVTEWLATGQVTTSVPVDFPTRDSIRTREWDSK